MLMKMLMHSSLRCMLSTRAFRVRQYSFLEANSQSSPKMSFFITSLKFSSDLLKFSRWILRQIRSIVLPISQIGRSLASRISSFTTNSICSRRSALCHTKMLQNFMQEVSVKLPPSISVSMRIRTSSASSFRMMFWKNSSFCRQFTKVTFWCSGQLKMQSLGFAARSSCWNLRARKLMRTSQSEMWATRTFSGFPTSTCRYSPKYFRRLLRSSTFITFCTPSRSSSFAYFFFGEASPNPSIA